MKKMIYLLLILSLVVSVIGCGKSDTPQSTSGEVDGPSGEVMLYSSMQDSQLSGIKKAFMEKYPNIKMDYYAAGTGKVMTKIATEQQAGGLSADMIWVGDPSNYVKFKEDGILETYESPEAVNIPSKFRDPDNKFIAGRVVVMGFTYNTNLVDEKDAPKTWEDLFKPEFKDQIVLTDPTSSGTTLYSVSALLKNEKYGWNLFKRLKEHGAKLESGSSGTVNKVGVGAYKVALGCDHVTRKIAKKGSPLGFSNLEEDLVFIASPIAIVKDAKNMDNAKLLYDFIISEEGQKVLAKHNTTPVHKNVKLENAISIEEAESRAMVVDNEELAKGKIEILNEFDKIFKE